MHGNNHLRTESRKKTHTHAPIAEHRPQMPTETRPSKQLKNDRKLDSSSTPFEHNVKRNDTLLRTKNGIHALYRYERTCAFCSAAGKARPAWSTSKQAYMKANTKLIDSSASMLGWALRGCHAESGRVAEKMLRNVANRVEEDGLHAKGIGGEQSSRDGVAL